MDEITAYLPGLSPVENKELCVRFDGGRLSSDGGVLVLREIEKRLGLAARLAGCLSDARDPASTTHSYADMIGARMFAIACGYEDCDDLDVLRFDPAFKLACGRLPESGRDLMSQPTLSRLENAPSWRELARMGLTMIDLFCDSFERVPQRIVLDIDDTPDAVHGGQQLALFNAHYDEYCFQPIHIFDAATAKPVLSLLRPGKRPSGDEAARVLRHVIGRIRRHWPRVEIAVRGDGHYGTPEVMDLLEDQGHGYILGLPGNARLSEIGQPWCEDAALRRVQSGKDKVRRFFQTGYQAKSWSRERKVVARVEATARGTDVRFVVTNLPGRAKLLYERVYCARGRMENMIKEHKLYTKSPYAKVALRQFYIALWRGNIAGWSMDRFEDATGLKLIWEGSLKEDLPPMPRFLNRLLALPIAEQNELFAELETRIEANIEQAIEAGTHEQGVETIRADSLAHRRHARPRVVAAQRHAEEEPQGRDRRVDRGRRRSLRSHLQLMAPQILRRCLVRRTVEKGREVPHRADVSALRLGRKTTDLHVLDHTPAQRADRLLDHDNLLCRVKLKPQISTQDRPAPLPRKPR